MRDRLLRHCSRIFVVASAGTGAGCGLLLGLDEFKDAPSSESSGTGTGTGTGGEGATCEPGEAVSCYEGPSETRGVGICKDGKTTCSDEGKTDGDCQGQVKPSDETCANPADENCDGQDCLLWAKVSGDISNQSATGATIDKDGSVILAGTFSGRLTFDEAAPLESSSPAVYVVKLNPDGTPAWGKIFSGNFTSARAVATTSKGNIVLTGTFRDSISIGSITHSTSEEYDDAVYIVELDADGNHLWSDTHEDGEQGTDISSIAVDSSDSIILFGSGYCHQACTSPLERIWLQKYDTTRTTAWSKRFSYTDVGVRRAGGVTTDMHNNILITGCFDETEDLGGGPISAEGGADAFVAKFDTMGDYVWAHNYGDSEGQCGSSIAADGIGNALVAGTFTGTIRIGTRNYTSTGMGDIFLLKVGQNGSTSWLRSFGNENRSLAPKVAVDNSGNIALVATTNGDIALGGSRLTSGGAADISLAKFGPDGAHGWSKLFGDEADQIPRAVAATGTGEVVLIADVQGAIDPGAGKLFSAGGTDILVAKFAP